MTQELGRVRNLLNWVVKIQGMFYNEFATYNLLYFVLGFFTVTSFHANMIKCYKVVFVV